MTEGKPRLTDAIDFGVVGKDELLRVAIAVERLSDHPLAAAVVSGGQERMKGEPPLVAYDVQSITGRGVKATIDAQLVYIGTDRLYAEVDGPRLPDSFNRVENNRCYAGNHRRIDAFVWPRSQSSSYFA